MITVDSDVVTCPDFGSLGCIKFRDAAYHKDIVFSGGIDTANDWIKDYVQIRTIMQHIMSKHSTKNFTPDQNELWVTWLDENCLYMTMKWGSATLPATVRWWINVVQDKLGRDVTSFGPDYGGNGLFENTVILKPIFGPADDSADSLKQTGSMQIEMFGRIGMVPFEFDGTYQKEIKFISNEPTTEKRVMDIAQQSNEWFNELTIINTKFFEVTDMDTNHNFTEAQKQQWWVWLSMHCDPFVARWGKDNTPATIRVYMNAVENNLEGRNVTLFGRDTFASGKLDPSYTMTNFGI